MSFSGGRERSPLASNMNLIIRHKRRWFEPKLPHLVFIDGHYAGMLKNDRLQLMMPQGSFSLRVQCGGPVPIGKSGKSIDLSLSATEQVNLPRNGVVVCEFHDRERLWNILFDIDIVLWIVSWFVQMPPLYKILSNAFFVIWMVRMVIIRKRYYKISLSDGQ